jgi:hypothetical protein
VRWIGVATGAGLAMGAVLILWATSLVDPPESVSRSLAVFSAVYPGTIRGAEVERIPCGSLRHLRLYVVCTNGCEDTWVIVGVHGLWPENLANPGRIPPQAVEESRARISDAVARDRLSLDRGGAREMIACYLRIEGRLPGLVLTPLDLIALEDARDSEEKMQRLAESLDAEGAVSRIDPVDTEDGYRARLLYWDTSLPDRPVLEIALDLKRNGVLRSIDVSESVRGGSAPGSTTGSPPF